MQGDYLVQKRVNFWSTNFDQKLILAAIDQEIGQKSNFTLKQFNQRITKLHFPSNYQLLISTSKELKIFTPL